jgi:hypothetical protein
MAKKTRPKKRNKKLSPFLETLKSLGFDSYQQYLRSDHWKSVRERYRCSKKPKKCQCCGSEKYELHHTTYERLGREWLKDLMPLCRRHHRAVHKYLRRHPEIKLGDTAIILEAITPRKRKPKGLA